jgi:hypothetical protein
MKFQILNNEQIGFYNEVGNLSSIIKPSGSNLVIHPISPGGDIELGQNGTVNDVELGNLATPVNMTFLGGGTITPNGNTLYIGDSSAGDSVILSNVTIGSSVVWSTGLSGSFSGSHYGDFYGDGRGLVGITATVEPAGPIGSIQFNNDINNSGSSDFIFNKTTGAVIITGSVNVSGSTTADFFFGNGAGLTGITSTFAPTGQDKSIQFNKGGTEISGSDGILFDYDNNNLNVKGYISASLLTGSATLTGSFTGDLNGDGTNITNVVGNTTFTGNPEIIGTLTTTGLNLTGSINISGSESSEIKILDDTTEAGLMLKNYGYNSRLGLFTSRGTAGGFSATGNGISWSNGQGGGQNVIINSRNGGSLQGNGTVALTWSGENGGYVNPFKVVDITTNINTKTLELINSTGVVDGTSSSLFEARANGDFWVVPRGYNASNQVANMHISSTGDYVSWGNGTYYLAALTGSGYIGTLNVGNSSGKIYGGMTSGLLSLNDYTKNYGHIGFGVAQYPNGLLLYGGASGNPIQFDSGKVVFGNVYYNEQVTIDALNSRLLLTNGSNNFTTPTHNLHVRKNSSNFLLFENESEIKKAEIDQNGNLFISGSEINFINLPSTDPIVAGRLFQTASAAIGASAGFQIVLISQG